MDNHEQFIDSLEKEVSSIVERANIKLDDFYDLCRTYSRILTNAKFFLDKGKMNGVFGYDDTDLFISEFNKITRGLQSKDIKESLFSAINKLFMMH